MAFDDLPPDWEHRPLTDPRLVADVLDLLVSHRARHDGALVLLLCDGEDRLVQPVEIGETRTAGEALQRARGLRSLFTLLADEVPDAGILVAVARRGGLSVTADDTCWAEAVADAAAGQVRLLGVHLVTRDGSRPIPRRLAA
jgi:hypothetical protein